MIRQFLERIEGEEMTIHRWIMGFIGILFIRFLLESLSSPSSSGIIPSDPYTLVHYCLFWTTLTFGLILLVGFFRKNYLTSLKAALFGLPVIWIAPIADIILSKGRGFTEVYLFDSGRQLILDF